MLLDDKDLGEYIKALSKVDHKTLSQKALKTCEEVGELAKVVLPYDNAYATTHRFADKQKIVVEIADTLLCLLSIQHDLSISDEVLTKTIWEKARYWHQLQVRAGRGTENLPFEIHITVVAPISSESMFPRIKFDDTCKALGVKALYLEMPIHKTNETITDYQTSSFHKGTNRTAYEETKRISFGLQTAGFKVIREKIETVPWHPAAPDLDFNAPMNPEELDHYEGIFVKSTHPMPPGCYFETHFVVVVDEESLSKLAGVERSGPDYVVRFSRNTAKKEASNKFKVIVTGRSNVLAKTPFQQMAQGTVNDLTRMGAEVVEIMMEFAVYDTAVSHDDAWIKGASE